MDTANANPAASSPQAHVVQIASADQLPHPSRHILQDRSTTHSLSYIFVHLQYIMLLFYLFTSVGKEGDCQMQNQCR